MSFKNATALATAIKKKKKKASKEQRPTDESSEAPIFLSFLGLFVTAFQRTRQTHSG